jgi:hypothetical protein
MAFMLDRAMPGMNRKRWAQVGIVVQFLALIRALGEFFRLQHVRGAALQIADVRPYVVGATISAAFSLVAVLLYFTRRYTGSLAVAVFALLVLLVYRFAFMS